LRIKIWDGLWLLDLLTVLLIVAIIVSPPSIWRIVLGLPFLFFFPGYTLGLALFPDKERIGNVERVALSFGVSIAVVPLVALIMNYSPWGITLESVLYSVVSFIFATSIAAWGRRQRLPEGERFNIEFRLSLPGWSGSTWDKVLSVVLVVFVLGALGSLGYAVAAPRVEEKFTEFYILGAGGKAEDYPEELVVGEEGKVVVGIINREHETVSYRVEVMVNGAKDTVADSVVLEHEGKWEEEVGFIPETVGEMQKVEFLLYKQGQPEVYQSLLLWVNVTGAIME
jgi:uncharacterized membrane protein